MKIVDLRDNTIDDISYVIPELKDNRPLLTAWQVAALKKECPKNCFVTVPDFLRYARIIKSGRGVSIIGLSDNHFSSFKACGTAGLELMKSPLRLLKMDFWLVAQALVKYDLSLLPNDFSGTVMLHSYLADFALCMQHDDFIKSYFRMSKHFRCGLHTQQSLLAMNSLIRQQLIPSALTYTDNKNEVMKIAKSNKLFSRTAFFVDVAHFPRIMQKKYRDAVVSL